MPKRRRSYLFSGLSEGRGVAEMMTSDAAPASPEVCDGVTGSDVFVIQDVAMVVQDAAAGQLTATPAEPRPHHLAVQRHHSGGARAEAR